MRNTTSKLSLRQNVPWRVHDIIARKKCLHVDAWLLQDERDNLFFLIETRQAGVTLLDSRTFLTRESEPLTEVSRDWRRAERLRHACIQRQINTPWARRYAPWLAGVHAREIQPHLHAPGQLRSVALHYVAQLGRDDPCEGLTNYHTLAAPAPAGYEEARKGMPRSEWNAQQRSILRTLQKLLD